jgi:hypothetical protein
MPESPQSNFSETFPHVVFEDNLVQDLAPEQHVQAIDNIQKLLLNLPKYKRIILNQQGMQVIAMDGLNGIRTYYQNWAQRFLSSSHTVLPTELALDFKRFYEFKYDSSKPWNDNQRHAEQIINEEVTHGLCMRLANSKLWINAVLDDFDKSIIENNKQATILRNALLNASRKYYSFEEENGVFRKCDLANYIAIANHSMPQTETSLGTEFVVPRDRISIQDLADEIPAEIEHIRNFLRASKKYGGQKNFRDDVQMSLDLFYNGKLKDVPAAQVDDYIDKVMGSIFPKTYPIFRDYEARLVEQAKNIEHDPSHYPVPSKINSWEFIRGSDWNNGFEYLQGGKFRS